MSHRYEFILENGKKQSVNLPFVLEIESNWEKIRALTFWTKEPETIYWIGDFNDSGKIIFWDIGANIGLYSLFCACVHYNSKIYSFEPQATNFLRLMANIHINDFSDMIFPQFSALSDKNGFAEFCVKNPEFGASGGQVCGSDGQMKYELPLWAGDNFAEMCGVYPTHIKLDVDGDELKILRGMPNILDHVTSMMVEANDPAVVEYVKGFGLEPDRNYNCLRGAGWERSSNTNIIFSRI